MLVRIVINWSNESYNFLRLTPNNKGIWNDIQFTLDPVTNCDYVIVCNKPLGPIQVNVPRDHLWEVSMEPPLKYAPYERAALRQYRRVYNQDMTLTGKRYIKSHGALIWMVKQSYDDLMEQSLPEKHINLTWITSNTQKFPAHQMRMALLEQIQGRVEIALWGRGFTRIENKWDALAPARYALAIENYSGPYYWTEKIADCLLAWTMPIYWGATNITDYFPEEAIARIDITDPVLAVEQIKEIINSDRFERNIDAIAHARQLVLNKHQFFPHFTNEIHQYEAISTPRPACPLTIMPPTEPKLISMIKAIPGAVALRHKIRDIMGR